MKRLHILLLMITALCVNSFAQFNVNIFNTFPSAPIVTSTPKPKKARSQYSQRVLHSGIYTVSATGETSNGTIEGHEINGIKIKIYSDHIECNGKILDPKKFYGEWTWYLLNPNTYYAVGPEYQMKQIYVTGHGNIYSEMYEE